MLKSSETVDGTKLMVSLYRCGLFAGMLYGVVYCAAGFAVAITDLHWMGNALIICTAAVAAHLGRGLVATYYLRQFPALESIDEQD